MNELNTILLDTDIGNKVEELINQHLPQTFPALSICVIYQGNIVLNHAWGWLAPQQQDYPITPSVLFDLASVTKLFVEATFLTFVTDGTATLDTPVVDIIPELGHMTPRKIEGGQDPFTKERLAVEPEFEGKSVDTRQVTFRHLLTHTSGLPPWRDVYNQASDTPPPNPRANTKPDEQRWKKALRAIVNYPFVGAIGSTVRYSDIGLMLLGEAVARLNNTTLDKAIYDRVCQPLGLESLTYNPIVNGISINQIIPTEIDRTWRNRRTWGEVHDENASGIGGVAGHAGLFGTAYDIAQFGQAWLQGNEELAISDSLRQEATQEQAQGQFRMGLGWMLKAKEGSSSGDLYSMSSYGHTGFTGTSLWVDPDQELVSAVLTNRVYQGRDPEGIHVFRRGVHDLIVQGVKQL